MLKIINISKIQIMILFNNKGLAFQNIHRIKCAIFESWSELDQSRCYVFFFTSSRFSTVPFPCFISHITKLVSFFFKTIKVLTIKQIFCSAFFYFHHFYNRSGVYTFSENSQEKKYRIR